MTTRISPRLRLKRAFTQYFENICASSVADPTDVFAAAEAYLDWRAQVLGRALTDQELTSDIAKLAGEIEQDMARRGAEWRAWLTAESVYARLLECIAVARRKGENHRA